MNGAGVPTPTTAGAATAAAAAGTAAPTTARWATSARQITPTATVASVLSAQQASNRLAAAVQSRCNEALSRMEQARNSCSQQVLL